jgi:hypothetical protein
MSVTTDKALKLLNGAEEIVKKNQGVVGLDGFVDQIIRVVDKRQSDGTPTYIPTIADWAKRVDAAAGKSTKFDMSVQTVKLGGNGPIMANAMAAASLPLTCIGNMGFPDLHPVFHPMKKVCKMITVADASYTDAVEFEDGKIMLSRQETAALVTWETLQNVLGKEALFKLFDDATFIALDNWSALPHMTKIWKKMQEEVCPKLKPMAQRRKIFFDLADPEFRLKADIAEALSTLAGFQKWLDTRLGLNLKESIQICDVLGFTVQGDDRNIAKLAAKGIQQKLGITGVVVHAREFAAAANADSKLDLVEGPYVEKPLISTGAGDHFNAGYGLGLILGGDLEQCMQLAVATSGFYVRTAQSPTIPDLRRFLQEIA